MGLNDKLICIDSQVFVWGIKKQYSKGQKDMVSKTAGLLEYLDEQKVEILLPAPVITEVLTPVPKDEYPTFTAIINKRFRVASLDIIAAMKCAEMIYDKKQNDKAFKEAREAGTYPRRKMKHDFLISAIAVANNAGYIYTNDSDIHKFCSAFIDVRHIPDISQQSEIEFGD
jgi:predicted nucleic acid-binding protein